VKLLTFLQKLTTTRLWLLSTGISIVMSEIITSGMSLLLQGEITLDYLLTGFVASLCVASLVTAGLAFFLEQQRQAADALEISNRRYRELAEELQRLNETLGQRVAEQVAKNMAQERMLIHQARLAAMGEMIGNIAHQWRQPLNALGLIIQGLRYDFRDGSVTAELMEQTSKQAMQMIQGMSRTIDDFRNFFRHTRERSEFHPRNAVQEALAILSASLEHSGIVVDLDDESEVVAYGYPNEYSQVLLNILSNAKDAIQANNVKNGVIHVKIGHVGNMASVSIRDNGGGIAPEIMPKIFDPYFTTRENGTGIGLYMSKIIIEGNMGGKIEACNVVGGAEFTVSCPLAETA
jgi:signal transduction histidine kinase